MEPILTQADGRNVHVLCPVAAATYDFQKKKKNFFFSIFERTKFHVVKYNV
jgi:hypothetical protein